MRPSLKLQCNLVKTVFVCFSVKNRYYRGSHQTRFILVGSDVNEMHVSFTKQKKERSYL